ncbi:30S ribosome-binding factor RbfA [bacterium]|nr:30S ribosome-binding factor RbfA [bacterium]HDJ30483.1 30S ribosome-binding factor RbfA [bacterium]
MSRRRILQVNELIKRELGKIISQNIDLSKEVVATITRINTSNNLIQAKVYVSVIPQEKSKEVLSILNKKVFDIQQKLNRRLRMRPVPKIIFVEEKETKKAQEIEKLLEEIKKN